MKNFIEEFYQKICANEKKIVTLQNFSGVKVLTTPF